MIMCVDLYRQFELADSESIAIIEEKLVTAPATNKSAENPLCMVCGDEIDGRIVYCRTCETPHHYDCWKYTGHCSTYGCGETRTVSRRKMNRTKYS